jgi:hypothetical protein
MGSFKKLNKADITTFPYYANKKWELTATAGSSGSDSFLIFAGQNADYSISGPSTNGQSWALVYASMNQMFYQSYTDSLDTGSLMFNVNTLESASSQRPTSSYFDYNNSPYIIKNYPTGANEVTRVIAIDKNIYGNKILPNSFAMSSSGFTIRDDGYGNLFGSTDGTISGYINIQYIAPAYFVSQSLPAGIYHVGNIFYAQGLAIITTGSFASSVNIPLNAPLKISFQNEHTIYENEVRCIVRESDFNLTYNPTIVSGSYFTTGKVRDFATGSDFQPYATSIGLYNDENDLLMVAKLAKPIVLSSDTDMTFIVRYDN